MHKHFAGLLATLSLTVFAHAKTCCCYTIKTEGNACQGCIANACGNCVGPVSACPFSQSVICAIGHNLTEVNCGGHYVEWNLYQFCWLIFNCVPPDPCGGPCTLSALPVGYGFDTVAVPTLGDACPPCP